jgi:predicted dienelactone hydrolase
VFTAAGDPVVVYYPVDASSTKGKQTYSIDLLRWFTGSPTAALPTGLPQNLPTTLATDAYSGVPVSTRGPFPVVLFSHGYGGYPEQSSFLTDHLARWGFVVFAPDHRSRDLKAVANSTAVGGTSDVQDLLNALGLARSINSRRGSLLYHRLDLSRVASLGHSAGGGAAITVAGHRAVRAYVALAPAPGQIPPAGKPGLIIQGAADMVVPAAGTRQLFASLPGPKRLIVIDGAGHNAFSDACTIGASQGGLNAIIGEIPLPADFKAIATDGCAPPDVFPPTLWPLIDHAVVSQLRWALGVDRTPVGMDSGLDTAFGAVHASIQTND